MSNIKKVIAGELPLFIKIMLDPFYNFYALRKWDKKGRPVPGPHAIKQKTVADFRKRWGLKILVETGTYTGQMTRSQLSNFERIFTIELNQELATAAQKLFAGHKKVQVFQGDSTQILPEILREIKEPVLLWLDAHYSAGITSRGNLNTPIIAELEAVFKSGLNHVILIDDARLFVGKDDYPQLEALREFVNKNRPDYEMEVEDDIIRLYPKQNG